MTWYYADGWTNDTSGTNNTTAGWQPHNYSYGGRIQSVPAGTCTKIAARLQRSPGAGAVNVTAALYDGSGNLVSSGSAQSFSNESLTWVEWTISASVSAGTYYVFFSSADTYVFINYTTSSTGKYITHAYANAWPDPATIGDESGYAYGVKMDVSASSGTTGTAAQTLPSITQAATGEQSFSGTSAQALPSVTQASAAAAGTSGTSAQTLPSLVQSATAVEEFTGTTAQTFPSVTQAAAATTGAPAVTGTATQTLPSVTQSASASEAFSGTASQTLPSVTQDAAGTAGEQPITGTAAQTLPGITQAATATETFLASSAQTLPAITQALSAVEGFSANVASALPSIAQAAVTAEGFSASAGQTLPSVTQAASATTAGASVTGTAAQTLPSVSQSAAGVADTAGEISQTLPSITQTADGDVVGGDMTGTIEQVLPSLSQSANSINIGSEKLPWFPGPSVVTPNTDPSSIRQYLQSVSGVANRANIGKINVVLDIVLESGSSTTTVTDKRLSQFSGASFDPMTANAAAEQAAGTLYVTPANRRSGEWTITHANNAQTDRRFRMVVLG